MAATEEEASDLGMEETELKLGLPGAGRPEGEIRKRSLTETTSTTAASVQLRLGGRAGVAETGGGGTKGGTRTPASKAQIVGWPPVRPCRRKLTQSCKFVKVAVDGAPYLRKVDLEVYNSYEQLLTALEEMFSCFTAGNYLNERTLVDPVNGTEFVPTYEDRDGDWMLVGDVPWKMFVESCKRLRLVKRSDACNLAPGTPEGSTNAR